jgi:hypothetical protein
MIKKDFVLLAEALRFSCPLDGEESLDYYQWKEDCQAIADALDRRNTNFDRDKFIRACEGRK